MKAYNIKTGGVRYTEKHDVNKITVYNHLDNTEMQTLMGRVLASDETSYWLKDAIKSSLEIKADMFSKSAIKKLDKTGGTAIYK